MIVSQCTVTGLNSDLKAIIPFLLESNTSFLNNADNVELIVESEPTLIEAIRDRICATISIKHTFTNKSITKFS